MGVGRTVTPHLSGHLLAFAPLSPSRNLHTSGSREGGGGVGKDTTGVEVGLLGTASLNPCFSTQPAQAPPPDASEQEVLVNNQPAGTGAGQAAHIRGDRGGHPTRPVTVFQEAALEMGVQFRAPAGEQQSPSSQGLFSALQEVNVLAQFP